MFLGFFCSSASFTQMQPEHYVLTKLAAWKCSYNYGCHYNLSPFSFLPFSLHHAGVSSLLFLIFPAVISAWDNEEEEGNPPHNTCAHNHTNNANTMDNLRTWWDSELCGKFGWQWVGEAAQPVLDWHPFCSVCTQRGREQKHSAMATTLKSTLILIYLQKQWKLCWYSPLFFSFSFCSRCMF